MSAIIIGGNECMGRTYCDLCAKYNISARAIPLKKAALPISWEPRISSLSVWTPYPTLWSSVRKRKHGSTARSWSSCVAAARPRWSAS